MTPTSRLIRAFRRFNADNIALWESLLSAQRPWESDPTHRGTGAHQDSGTGTPQGSGTGAPQDSGTGTPQGSGTGAPQDRGNAGTPEEPVRRHRDRTRWTLAR